MKIIQILQKNARTPLKEIEGRKRAEFTRGGCGLKMGLRRALRACVVVADATRRQILQTYDRFVLSYEKIEPD